GEKVGEGGWRKGGWGKGGAARGWEQGRAGEQGRLLLLFTCSFPFRSRDPDPPPPREEIAFRVEPGDHRRPLPQDGFVSHLDHLALAFSNPSPILHAKPSFGQQLYHRRGLMRQLGHFGNTPLVFPVVRDLHEM